MVRRDSAAAEKEDRGLALCTRAPKKRFIASSAFQGTAGQLWLTG